MKKSQTLTLAAVGFLGPFQFDTYLPALPQITQDLGTSEVLAQSTVTASLLGMALGQILMGPISDSRGRRVPLLITLSIFVISALACSFAPSIQLLIIARVLLGMSAAGGFVIVNAYIRDRASGTEAAKLFATQASIASLAPILAPLVGAQLLLIGDWRFVFVCLAFIGVAIAIAAFLVITETLTKAKRRAIELRSVVNSWAIVAKDGRYPTLALSVGLLFFGVAGFLAATPYAMVYEFDITSTQYGYFFATVTLGIFVTTRINAKLVPKFGPITLLRFGMKWLVGAGILLGVLAIANPHSLLLSSICFGLAVSSMGFIATNATALFMEAHGDRAAVAAGLMGFSISVFGALGAPLPALTFGVSISGIAAYLGLILLINGLLTGLRLKQLVAKGKLTWPENKQEK